MSYLVAGVVLAVGLCLLNLALTLAVIRRLREHTDLLSSRHGTEDAAPMKVMIGAGEAPGDFAVVARDGTTISSASHGGRSLLAFVSPECDLCHEQLPELIAYARRFPGGRDRAVVVVIGPPAASEELATRLEPVARVVLEDRDGALYTAFGVNGYPAYAVVEDGVVRASGYLLNDLPAPAVVS